MPPRRKSARKSLSLKGNGPLLDLPLDIFIEAHHKALRAFLLDRSSAEFIWRASFEIVEGSPPQHPPYTNQVQWTCLLFEEVCHVCWTALEHDYSFDPVWLLATKLPKKLTGSSVTARIRLPDLWRDVFPCVNGLLFYVHITHGSIDKARAKELERLKSARWTTIKDKFCQAGWRASLMHRHDWYKVELVNTPRALTEEEWDIIGPELFNTLGASESVKCTVMRERFQALERAITESHLDDLSQNLLFSPRIVDVALLPGVRAVLEGDLKLVITAEDLKATLESKLPDLLTAWSDTLEAELRAYTRAALKLSPEWTPLNPRLLISSGHFTEKKRCRTAYYGRQNYYYGRQNYEPETYEERATQYLRFKLEPARTVLQDVIKQYGKDPQTATCEEMDAAPGKLWCMRCVLKNQPEGWRDAVAHSMKFHEKFASLKARWEVDFETE
ncbi:hypothetical protein K438DRAFT_2054283 [Mycena galopus ATCC 62051]|nr:hypothetical protein K438DRAFT_2054283 [Mycena galopus ATCC 62051]